MKQQNGWQSPALKAEFETRIEEEKYLKEFYGIYTK